MSINCPIYLEFLMNICLQALRHVQCNASLICSLLPNTCIFAKTLIFSTLLVRPDLQFIYSMFPMREKIIQGNREGVIYIQMII